jgi:hypothetical protein
MKNPHAVALGRLGGAKGGLARSRNLTPERRREIARAASTARWSGRLPELLRSAFWQYKLEELHIDEHRGLVMLHLLTAGSREQLAWLRRRVGDDAIEAWIRDRKARGFPVDQASPWVPATTVRRWHRADPNSATWEAR